MKAKNPLAAAIATGQIAVKAIKIPIGKMYEHITGILTVTMLAIMIVMAPDPAETEKRSNFWRKSSVGMYGLAGIGTVQKYLPPGCAIICILYCVCLLQILNFLSGRRDSLDL